MILKPCYDFPKPNEDTVLAQTKASVSIHGKPYEVNVEVRLRLLPSPRIEIEGALPESLGILQLDSIENVTIGGKDIPGFMIRAPFSSPGGSSFVWVLNHKRTLVCGTAETEMVGLVFHLFNYTEFHGTRRSTEETDTGSTAIYHIDLNAAGWNVEIRSLSTTSDRFKILRETGGYALTHVGSLQKEDGASFDCKAAEDMLSALRHFFSFSKGMWCNPCIAVGFDDKDDRVWESWSSPGDYWGNPSSWFDPHHCDELANLFPGFMAKWENEDLREALHKVIYWYLNSNSSKRGIDAGIILSQAAIERLSFEYVVRQKRLIGAEGFKSLRASDKFRLLFSSLDIPLDIPASLPELHKLAGQFNWVDAPHAITDVRNSLVHPDHKRSGQFGKVFFPTWNLGQWYLELALLRVCDYSGTYGNRLIQRWVGSVECVPWEEL